MRAQAIWPPRTSARAPICLSGFLAHDPLPAFVAGLPSRLKLRPVLIYGRLSDVALSYPRDVFDEALIQGPPWSQHLRLDA